MLFKGTPLNDCFYLYVILVQRIKLQPVFVYTDSLINRAELLHEKSRHRQLSCFFKKPTNTTKRATTLFQFTSCACEVILRELSTNYRVTSKNNDEKPASWKCRLQFPGYRLTVAGYTLQVKAHGNLSDASSMFDECLIGFAHLQNPCLMMFNEKHFFDKTLLFIFFFPSYLILCSMPFRCFPQTFRQTFNKHFQTIFNKLFDWFSWTFPGSRW